MGNLLGLAVLASVVQRPMHPYEMAMVLRARGKETDMPIKWGSFYTVVQNLEKHGYLEAAGNDRQGGRPERTIYRITEAGRGELEDWVRELVSTPETEHPRFEAGLSVLGALAPKEATELLHQRVVRLEQVTAAARLSLQENGREVPRLFLIEAEYDLAVREAELIWVRSLLDELTTGSFPGLDQWNAFHETGEVPPELTALAEKGSAQG
ncbi:PadR family transcriptional regulator [Streptacidiphilus sp. PAMC 29251]